MPENEFWQVVQADPTYDGAERPQKKGKYTQWLLHAYKKNVIATESLTECAFLLDVFHRYRPLLEEKDIMKYDTLQKLRDALEPYLDDPYADIHITSKAMRIRKIKEGAEKVYEDEEWAVFVPHTWEASRYYGKGTRWCTASEYSDNYFNQYNSKGVLYININRRTKEKWQFHFETQTFCDAADNAVALKDVPLTDGLRQFYHLTANGPIPRESVNTFADAITLWNANGSEGTLRFIALYGDTSCVEALVLPPSYSNYSEMFQFCNTITTLDLSQWDVSSARDMEGMFYMCESLTFLRLDGWDMRNVQEFNGMFELCDHLNTISLDYCHFPDTTKKWDIFEGCRDLRDINMHYCDMQSVRFVLREVVEAQLLKNITFHLTYDSDEQRAYNSLMSIIDQAEEIMQEQIVLPSEKNIPELMLYIEKLVDTGNLLRNNPLYFEQISAVVDFQISKTIRQLDTLLNSKIEMTFTSHQHSQLMITRPDVKQYKEKVENRYRQVQVLLPLLERFAERAPHHAQNMLLLRQHLSKLPSASQIDIYKEIQRLGISDRWHVTIPALSKLMDRITNNTRKGVEHLRYTNLERMRVILGLLIIIVWGGTTAIAAAAIRGGEYWLMGFFAICIIATPFNVGWETLKKKSELKAFGWIILSMVLYVLFIVYAVRPIWVYFHPD